MLSGIQHYRFCPRQWALIHIEQQWADNRLTMEGEILHKHVDEAAYRQKCGDYISLRSVSIASHQLGLYGISDVIELHPTDDDENSISHPKYPGRWLPYPVEYKHGRPKKNEVDEVQLAAQAMCLEELYVMTLQLHWRPSDSTPTWGSCTHCAQAAPRWHSTWWKSCVPILATASCSRSSTADKSLLTISSIKERKAYCSLTTGGAPSSRRGRTARRRPSFIPS